MSRFKIALSSIVFCVIIIFIILFVIKDYVKIYENVYEYDDVISASGENGRYNYDVVINDDSITFYDDSGNYILYSFEEDKLANVFNVFNAKSEPEAKRIAAYFLNQVGNGEIEKVDYEGTVVAVTMDITFFDEYMNLSKKQIEDILLNNFSVNVFSGDFNK